MWKAIHEVDHFSERRLDLRRVARLGDADGRPRWKEEGRHGAITFELDERGKRQSAVFDVERARCYRRLLRRLR